MVELGIGEREVGWGSRCGREVCWGGSGWAGWGWGRGSTSGREGCWGGSGKREVGWVGMSSRSEMGWLKGGLGLGGRVLGCF